ncbi:MAG: hypothetical protein KC940_15975 [Candidatus Omnitrophica bacterium]|nr:hypothetical protein [Candidatus Omnitrophota bacterium]
MNPNHLLILTAVCAILALAVHTICRKKNWTIQRRLGRNKGIPSPTSEGGLVFLLGFLVCLAYSSSFIGRDILLSPAEMKSRHLGLALALIWTWAAGRFVDSKNLSHLYTTAVLTIGAAIATAFGFRIDTLRVGETVFEIGWMSIPGTLLWFVVISEFFRLLDGLDGLLVLGVGAAVSAQIWILEPEEGYALLLCYSLLPVLIGLFPWRIYPARIELKGIGAYLPGFIFGAITLVGRQKAFTTKAVLLPSIVLFAVFSLFALWLLEQHLFPQKGGGRRERVGESD